MVGRAMIHQTLEPQEEIIEMNHVEMQSKHKGLNENHVQISLTCFHYIGVFKSLSNNRTSERRKIDKFCS